MYKKQFLKHILIALLSSILLLMVNPAAAAEDEEKDLDFNGSDCISVRSIRDYTPLDDRTLLIWGGSKRPYYVRLFQPSFDMNSSIGMRVHSRDDRLCPYGGDGLIFGTFNDRPVSVRAISRITVEQADQILVRYGKKEGSEPQTPAPKEVEGAEVEELD